MKKQICAILASIAILGLGCSSNLKHEYISYIYTIEVTTYNSVSQPQQNTTVDIKWPFGNQKFELKNLCESKTVTIDWPVVSSDVDNGIFINQVHFSLEVEASKPDHLPWQAAYIPGDFVKTGDNTYCRVDQIRLKPVQTQLTPQQRETLSLALPCGLDLYSMQHVEDIDGDQSPDVLLSFNTSQLGNFQGTYQSENQSNYAEIRYMSLRDGKWRCLFLANHQGMFLNGTRVADCPPTPYGYSASGGFLGDETWLLTDLHPVDAEKTRIQQWPIRHVIWRNGSKYVDILNFDPSDSAGSIDMLKDNCVSVRMQAAETLGASGDQNAIEPLIEALSDDNSYVRRAILEALSTLTGEKHGEDKDAWKTWHNKSKSQMPKNLTH